MKYDEFHDLVRANGWVKLRQSGSQRSTGKEQDPVHTGKELGKGLESKIRKDMGLK